MYKAPSRPLTRGIFALNRMHQGNAGNNYMRGLNSPEPEPSSRNLVDL